MRFWKRVDKDGNTITVESYSHSLDIIGAIEIDEKEFDAYIASLPPIIRPVRELELLARRVSAIEDSIKLLATEPIS